MNVRALEELAEGWREEASILRKRGVMSNAETLASCADELEAGLREWEYEELTLEDAARESNYSYSRLQRLVADERLPNAGERGSPKVRRKDLPCRPSRREVTDGPRLAEKVISSRSGR